AADESRADAFARKVLQLAVDRLAERVHQRVDLLGRTLPIFGRERVDDERAHAEVDRRFDDGPQRPRAGTMTGRNRQPAPPRPPAARARAPDCPAAAFGFS